MGGLLIYSHIHEQPGCRLITSKGRPHRLSFPECDVANRLPRPIADDLSSRADYRRGWMVVRPRRRNCRIGLRVRPSPSDHGACQGRDLLVHLALTNAIPSARSSVAYMSSIITGRREAWGAGIGPKDTRRYRPYRAWARLSRRAPGPLVRDGCGGSRR
jgi:hypothetical protein